MSNHSTVSEDLDIFKIYKNDDETIPRTVLCSLGNSQFTPQDLKVMFDHFLNIMRPRINLLVNSLI